MSRGGARGTTAQSSVPKARLSSGGLMSHLFHPMQMAKNLWFQLLNIGNIPVWVKAGVNTMTKPNDSNWQSTELNWHSTTGVWGRSSILDCFVN